MTDEEIRQAYDILMGDGNGAAWQTRVQTDIDPRTGVGVHTRPYEYSPQELQAAMDAGDEDNPWRAGLFNYILQNTGNPRMAVTGTNLAEYAPLVGTALAAKDAEIAVRDLPDAWREGNTADLLGNIAQIGLSGADVALTMVPFAKPIWKGGRNVVRNMGRRGPVPTMYSNPLMRAADEAGDDYVRSLSKVEKMRRDANIQRFGYDPNEPSFVSAVDDIDYRGGHTAPQLEEGASLDNPTMMFGGDDIYTGNALQYFGTGSPAMDRESLAVIQRAKANPNATVTVYRAVPSGVSDKVNAGDWVTTSKQYAKDHGESALGGDYKVISQKVKASELATDGNSIHEWGWWPKARAGVGGLGLGLLSMQPDRAQTEEDTRQYLGGLLQ